MGGPVGVAAGLSEVVVAGCACKEDVLTDVESTAIDFVGVPAVMVHPAVVPVTAEKLSTATIAASRGVRTHEV
jgi:hypothetical protein